MNRLSDKNASRSKVVLLMIDVINDFDFPEADELVAQAEIMARNIAKLKRRAKQAGVPIVYVNDNFGRWRSDFKAIVEFCGKSDSRGRNVVRRLKPTQQDYFVLKPKHSGFFSTTLDTLLQSFGTTKVILTGVAANKGDVLVEKDGKPLLIPWQLAYLRRNTAALVISELAETALFHGISKGFPQGFVSDVLSERRCSST